MPVPNIFVFDSKWSNMLVENFEAARLNPFFNARVKDIEWFKKNMVAGKHRVYWVHDQKLYDYEIDVNAEIDILPHFCIIFNDEIGADIWKGIKMWLEAEVLSFNSEFFKTDEFLAIDKFITRIERQKNAFITEGDDVVYEGLKGKCLKIEPEDLQKPEYEFRCKYVASNDTKFYEVKRSNTKLPFTVVLKNFVLTKKTDEYFFTDIYGSRDWDYNRRECKYDFSFLCKLWKELGLVGEFTMEIVKKRIDSCYIERIPVGEVPAAEPIIYRRCMADVISSIMKRKDPEILPNIFKK